MITATVTTGAAIDRQLVQAIAALLQEPTSFVAHCRRADLIEQLERAVDQRESWVPHLMVEPGLDPLRDDPRFQKVLMQLRFPKTTLPKL